MTQGLEQSNSAEEDFREIGPGIVTFTYDPPPIQSAEEFRKTFAEEFLNTLRSQIEQPPNAETAAFIQI